MEGFRDSVTREWLEGRNPDVFASGVSDTRKNPGASQFTGSGQLEPLNVDMPFNSTVSKGF